MNSSRNKSRSGARRSCATNSTATRLARNGKPSRNCITKARVCRLSRAKKVSVWVWRSASRNRPSVSGVNSHTCRPSSSRYW
ncbi:hypothetical protein D3C81_2031320 [compost metagenome]